MLLAVPVARRSCTRLDPMAPAAPITATFLSVRYIDWLLSRERRDEEDVQLPLLVDLFFDLGQILVVRSHSIDVARRLHGNVPPSVDPPDLLVENLDREPVVRRARQVIAHHPRHLRGFGCTGDFDCSRLTGHRLGPSCPLSYLRRVCRPRQPADPPGRAGGS